MNIPDIKIECLRCTTSDVLTMGAAQPDAGGTWRPINARRPEGWIAGPVALGEMTKGICPKCAPDWIALQEQFISSVPTDPTIEARKPFSITAKAQGNIPQRIASLPSTHIPVRDEEPVRPSRIPMMAESPEQPQVQQAAAPVPQPMRQLAGNRGVTMTANRLMGSSPQAVRATRIPQAAAPVAASVVLPRGEASRSIATANKIPTSVPATTMTRVQAAQPVAQPMAQAFAQSVGGVHSQPVPIQRALHAQPVSVGQNVSRGMVTVSAPVPIIQEATVELPDGGSMKGCVTISAPTPIAK